MSEAQLELAGDQQRLRLVQITDTHLGREPGGTLLGMDTDFSLQQVLRRIKAERDGIDLVLGTADIADSGSESAYRRAADYFAELGAPALWLPGNHDLLETMCATLGRSGGLERVCLGRYWQIVMLNSQIPGQVGGRLGPDQLEFLEAQLRKGQEAGLFSLICLHHQPVPMGSAWIDQQMVVDSEAFWHTLSGFDQVRAVLWGHVHQHLDSKRGDVQLLATPSSCIQFAPASDDFKVDDVAPGYRWLDLLADGRIETGRDSHR